MWKSLLTVAGNGQHPPIERQAHSTRTCMPAGIVCIAIIYFYNVLPYCIIILYCYNTLNCCFLCDLNSPIAYTCIRKKIIYRIEGLYILYAVTSGLHHI